MGLIIKNRSGSKNGNRKTQKVIENRNWLNKNDVNVEVTNLSVGLVYYRDTKTKEVYTWGETGDSKLLPMSVVFTMLSSNKKLLEDLTLGITFVMDNEAGLRVKEIVEVLGIESKYKPFRYDLTNIDGFLIDSDVREFQRTIDECDTAVATILAERFSLLTNLKEVNDRTKEDIFRNKLKKEYLFSNRI